MTRVACKIAARSVRLVIVLLLLAAWWEPLYMQANTCSVCASYESFIHPSAGAESAPVSGDIGQAEEKRASAGRSSGRMEDVKHHASDVPEASEQAKELQTSYVPMDAEQMCDVQAADAPEAAEQASPAQVPDVPAEAGQTNEVRTSDMPEEAGKANKVRAPDVPEGAEKEDKPLASDVSSEAAGADRAGEVYTVVATGYYAGVESTGKSPGHPGYGITYSGVRVRRGIVSTIAADPNLFPIGTVLYIPGYGYGVVADIGGAVKGPVIDLYFPSKEDVYRQWGKRTVKVVVIERGDGRLDEARLQQLETVLSSRTPPSDAL